MTNNIVTHSSNIVLPAGYRLFANVEEPNTRYQIAEGDNEDARNKPTMTFEGLIWPRERYGDKWIKFSDGLLMTDDPDAIAWCEAHHPHILDMERPDADFLAKIAQMQTPREDYEPELNRDTDLLALAQKSIQSAVDAAVAQATERLKGEI